MRPDKNAPFHRRFGNALSGVRRVSRREKSFRTQLALGVVGGSIAGWLRPGGAWVALFLLASAMVLALELVNAALEEALDALHPDYHPSIGAAKDAAAGAVLVASMAALGVGGLMILSVAAFG